MRNSSPRAPYSQSLSDNAHVRGGCPPVKIGHYSFAPLCAATGDKTAIEAIADSNL